MAVGFLLCWTLIERLSGRKDLSNCILSMMIAGVVLIILPSISIFIVGQKQLIRGMFSGAVKG